GRAVGAAVGPGRSVAHEPAGAARLSPPRRARRGFDAHADSCRHADRAGAVGRNQVGLEALLAVNMVADALRGLTVEPQAAMGLPIVAAILLFLALSPVRRWCALA